MKLGKIEKEVVSILKEENTKSFGFSELLHKFVPYNKRYPGSRRHIYPNWSYAIKVLNSLERKGVIEITNRGLSNCVVRLKDENA